MKREKSNRRCRLNDLLSLSIENARPWAGHQTGPHFFFHQVTDVSSLLFLHFQAKNKRQIQPQFVPSVRPFNFNWTVGLIQRNNSHFIIYYYFIYFYYLHLIILTNYVHWNITWNAISFIHSDDKKRSFRLKLDKNVARAYRFKC